MGENNRIIIIGGVACGPKVAARARRVDPHAEITMVHKGKYLSYAGCGLPFYVAGAVKILDGLLTTSWGAVRDTSFFNDVKAITVFAETEATAIDRDKKEVTVKNLATGEEKVLAYDKLVMATGAAPVKPPIEGLDLKNVFTLRTPEDADNILKCIDAVDAEKAVIMGGGRISLEVVDALTAQAVDSVLVEMMDHVLPKVIDADIAQILTTTLTKEGVEVRTSEKVLKLEGDADGNVKKVITDKGEIEADFVVVAVGVRPTTDLAKAAGLELTDAGMIAVNEQLQTNDPDIYAGGDCIQSKSLVTGGLSYAPLGSTANKHGRVIGNNVTGGTDTFPGVLGTSVMKTMGTNVVRTGLSVEEAEAAGYEVVTAIVPGHDKSHFYPGGKEMSIKMVADAKDGRVIGAQIIGPGEVARRIDTIAAAITFGAKVHDVGNLDVGYAPPFATAMDPLLHAANTIRNKMQGLANSVSVTELKQMLDSDEEFLVVDVRGAGELEKLSLKDNRIKAIPLEELRARVGELPKDKKVITMCKLGSRSYEAARAIVGAGVKDVSYLEGGLTIWVDSGLKTAGE